MKFLNPNDVCIAILGHETHDLVYECAAQFAAATCDVYIIDNGSSQPYFQDNRLKKFPIIRSETNRWFSGGWNLGMELLTKVYDYVWMVTSDMIFPLERNDQFIIDPPPEFPAHKYYNRPKAEMYNRAITLLYQPFAFYYGDDDLDAVSVAAVTPAFNSPHAVFHPEPYRQQVNYREMLRGFAVPWIDWSCPLMSSQAWQHVGEFDAENFPGYGVDIDWCHRAKLEGWELRLQPIMEAYHIGSVTVNTMGEAYREKQNNVASMNAALQKKWSVSDYSELIK